MLIKYLGTLLNRASKGSVLLTDRLTILLVPFSTFVLWGLGVEMTDSLQETFWLGVALTVTAVVVLRLGAASYILWKEDQAEKVRLRGLHLAELERPDRLERDAAHGFAIGLRNKLGERLARQVALAEMMGLAPDQSAKVFAASDVDWLGERMIENEVRIRELISALSYDVPLRICAFELDLLANAILVKRGHDCDDEIAKLQSLKKVVFRVVHKKDKNTTLEILSLIEVKEIIGRPFEEKDGLFFEIQEKTKGKDIRGELIAQLQSGDTDSR